MYLDPEKTELERYLSRRLLRFVKTCMRKPVGPEAARIHNTKEFVAELKHGNIHLEGFAITKSMEFFPTFDPQIKRPIYTITHNKLPPVECFVQVFCDFEPIDNNNIFSFKQYKNANPSIEFLAHVYDAIYEQDIYDDDVGFVFRFLEQFKEIADELAANSADFQKRRKITEFSSDSIKTWFAQICQELGCSYFTKVQRIQSKLYVKLNDDMQLEIVVQHKNFQEVMPELHNIIQNYGALCKNSKIKMRVSKSALLTLWNEPQKYQEDEDEEI